MRRPVLRFLLVGAFFVVALSACAQGDFGRPRPSLIGDDPHDWLGAEAVGNVGLPASQYPLTEDERQLRDLAYPLIAPPYDRNHWYGVLAERGLVRDGAAHGILDEATYWTQLTGPPHRSPTSRYARVHDDSRNDVVRLDVFFGTARRVADMDERRRKSLAYVSNLGPGEHNNAINRINENIAVVDWVCRSVHARIIAYRFALERLVIAAPSRAAVEGERAIGLLQQRAAGYCRAPAVIAKG